MTRVEILLESVGKSIATLSSAQDNDSKINFILETIGIALQADRSYIFVNSENDQGEKFMNYTYEWCKEGIQPILNIGLIDSITWDYFPEFFEKLSQKISVNDLVRNSDNEVFRETMEVQNIKSYLFISIFSGEEFWGYMGFDNSEDRIFSPQELIAIESIAHTLGNSLLTEKKSIELIRSQRHHLSDIEVISNVLFNLNLNFEIIFLNPYWSEFTGYTLEESKNQKLMSFFSDPDKMDRQITGYAGSSLSAPLQMEPIFIKKDGCEAYTRLTISKVFDTSDQVVRLTGTLVDISRDRRNLEQISKLNLVLQAINETQLNSLQHGSSMDSPEKLWPLLLSITKSQLGIIGQCIRINEEIEQQAQLAWNNHWPLEMTDESDGITIKELNPADIQELFESAKSSKNSKIIVAVDSRKLPNSAPDIRELLVIPIRKNEDILGFIAFGNKDQNLLDQDLSLILPVIEAYANMLVGFRIMREKQQLENNYLIVSQNSGDLIAIQAKDQTYTFISPSVEKIMGLKPNELLGKRPEQVFGNHIQEVKTYDGMIRSLISFPINHSKSKTIILEAISKPMTDRQGKVVGYVTTGRDVTDREILLKQLKKALETEKDINQLKSGFISLASHEFRTPLATILSSSEILQNLVGERQEKVTQHVSRIKAQTHRLISVLTDILLLEKNTANKITVNTEKIYIISFLHQVVHNHFPLDQEFQRVNFQVPDKDFSISSDSTLLSHIFKNIIENALKYSQKPLKIEVREYPSFCELKFMDKGVGIAKGDQKHLFDSFFRGRNVSEISGTGLGLNIVKEFSQKIGAEVSISSKLNQGTTVTVKLPKELNSLTTEFTPTQ
ncbi:sensor histidine kinase [Algoriphagus namhaensis]